MKRFLIAAVMGLFALGGATLKTEKAEAQGCQPAGYYSIKGAYPIYYGVSRTLSNTASDTIRMHIPSTCRPYSVSFNNDHLKVTGTPAGTTYLYGSTNNGISYEPTALTSYSVTVSSTTVPQTKTYQVNAGANIGYTDLMWVWVGTGTMVGSWISYVTIK